MYIAVGKIRIRKLCLNGISDPIACKLQVLLIAELSLLLSVWDEGKEGSFLELKNGELEKRCRIIN